MTKIQEARRIVKTFSCLCLALLASGCGTTRGPDNRQWHSISCSTFIQVNFCQEEALAICPNGYDIYNPRSEEHTSELPSLMRISYSDFCLKTRNQPQDTHTQQ